MFQIILGFTMLVMLVTLYASSQYSVKENKNLILGIRLPAGYADYPEVTEILGAYKRTGRILLAVFFLAGIPVFFIRYTSLIIAGVTLWFCLYMWLNSYCTRYYGRKLMLIKSRNRWFTGEEGGEILTDEKTLAWFRKHRLLIEEKEIIYVDDDKYWIKGYYCNPDDKKVMVNKRFGSGITLNMAAGGAKAFLTCTFAFSFLILAGVILLFAAMDFTTFKLSVNGETVSINAPLYGYQFRTDEVKEVTLNQGMLKNGRRTNGAGTDTYLLGNFYYEEYGKARDYLYKDTPLYIALKLNGLTVFFNAKSEEETREYYDLLKGIITN